MRTLSIMVLIMFGLFSATGLDPVGSSTTPSPSQSIDLLGALGLHNGTWKGVTIARGPQQLRPAYQLQGNYTCALLHYYLFATLL